MAVAFAANWVLNLLWSPLFFKARRPDWALGDVMLLWASVALMIVVLAPWSPVAAALRRSPSRQGRWWWPGPGGSA